MVKSDPLRKIRECRKALYPTLFKEYRFLRESLKIVLDKYVNIIDDRIEAKRSGDKTKDTFLKLVLNSFSGLVDSNVTWLYSPEQIIALRCFGQLIQLRLIEEATKHKGVMCIFSNTDGSAFLIKRELLPTMCKILRDNEKEFRVTWEMTLNKKMVFSNTNTYISIIDESFMLGENGEMINHKTGLNKVKKKGALFRHGDDIPLGDACNEQVIAKALEQYFVNGTDPEEFIKGGESNGLTIFDFCCSKKVNKQFFVKYGDEIVQNLNRYYFSRRGLYLTKIRKSDVTKISHLHKGNPVLLLNNYKEGVKLKDYNINYNYYIHKVKKHIAEMETFLHSPPLYTAEDFQ